MVQGVPPISRKGPEQAFRVNLPKVVDLAVDQQNGNLVPIEAVGIHVLINVYFDEYTFARFG
jgi:hypothetical protein